MLSKSVLTQCHYLSMGKITFSLQNCETYKRVYKVEISGQVVFIKMALDLIPDGQNYFNKFDCQH